MEKPEGEEESTPNGRLVRQAESLCQAAFLLAPRRAGPDTGTTGVGEDPHLPDSMSVAPADEAAGLASLLG